MRDLWLNRLPPIGAVILALSVAAPATVRAADPVASPTQGVVFFSIRVAPDYTTSHTIFAAGAELQCQSSCSRLFRSTDGGAHWRRAGAIGWTNGDVRPALTSRGLLLVSTSASGMQVSRDGGEHFSGVNAPGGALDVSSTGGGDARAIVANDSGPWHQIDLGDLVVQEVPGTAGTLRGANPMSTGPGLTAGGVAGLAAGIDVTSGFPAVERCTPSWHCDAPSIIQPANDGMIVQASSAFAVDGTVFARSVQHGTVFRSGDGGRTFRPVTVVPAQSAQVISTVQGFAFSLDFNAAMPRGTVDAAVLGVTKGAGSSGQVVGGVYDSGDGGVSWLHVGAPSELDNGSTAIAVTPDGRVVAAYLDTDARTAGLLCMTDGTHWLSACPASAGQPAPPTSRPRGQGGQPPMSAAANAAPADGGPSMPDTATGAVNSHEDAALHGGGVGAHTIALLAVGLGCAAGAWSAMARYRRRRRRPTTDSPHV